MFKLYILTYLLYTLIFVCNFKLKYIQVTEENFLTPVSNEKS